MKLRVYLASNTPAVVEPPQKDLHSIHMTPRAKSKEPYRAIPPDLVMSELSYSIEHSQWPRNECNDATHRM